MSTMRLKWCATAVTVGSLVLAPAEHATPIHAQARAQRIADTIVPAGPPVVLSSGLGPTPTFQLLLQLLRVSAVPFGLESTAATPLEITQLPRVPQQASLNGLRLADALDAVVRLSPDFRWSETNGRIVVRAVGTGQGVLDRQIPHLAVAAATPETALGALVATLDRDANAVSPRPTASAGPISVTLDHVTVLDALNAIGAADGSSWVVQYTGSPASIDTARISFVRPGQSVTSESPARLRGASNAPAPGTIRMGAPDFGNLLTSYAARVNAQVGVEQLDVVRGPGQMLDLSAVPHEGIGQIVATDARYEWSQSGTIFHVEPKTPAATPSPLETTVPHFAVTDEPVGAVFDRVAWALGSSLGGAGRWFEPGAPELAPVTFAMPDNSTVRAVLDALCRASSSSWVFRRQARNNSAELSVVNRRWQLTASVLAPPAPARAPGSRAVPVQVPRATVADALLLDKAIGPFAATEEPVGQVVDRILWAVGVQPGGGGQTAREDSFERVKVTFNVPAGATARQALDALGRAHGALAWQLVQTSPDAGEFSLRLTAGSDWPVSRLFQMPISALHLPATAPTRALSPPLPASLDRHIEQVDVTSTTSFAFHSLASGAHVVMGIELLPQPPISPDPRVIPTPPRPSPPVRLGPGPLSDALAVLAERLPEYAIAAADGVIDVTPIGIRDFLDAPIDRFEIHDAPILQAVQTLRHQINPAIPADAPREDFLSGPGFGSIEDRARRASAAKTVFDRPLTLTADRATPREILNRLVAQNGELFWRADYDAAAPTVAAQEIETDCTIWIETFSDVGLSRGVPPARRVAPRPVAAETVDARTMAAPGPSNPLLHVRLPFDGPGMASAASNLSRGLRIPLGVEAIVPTGPPPSPGVQDLYDFNGLSVSDALDKLLASMPDYVWRKDGDIYHIQPKIFVDKLDVALSAHLDGFHQQLASPFEALSAIFSVLGSPLPPRRGGIPPPVVSGFERPITVDLGPTTVRDVLDDLVRQGKTLSWIAEYATDAGTAARLQLGLRGFDFGSVIIQGPGR